jgi:hypothetical protein
VLPDASLQPFSSDGCSLFPDRSLISRTDWCDCCLAHDLAYWRGGTQDERLAADQALRSCVFRATSDRPLAELMYQGVRAGGGPYFYTHYRWGYGWPLGRNYRPLSAEEEESVSRLRTQYFAKNPTLSCKAIP